MQLGLDNFLLPQQIGADVGDPGRATIRSATNFVRLKTAHRLYSQKTNGVTLLTPTVFRAEIPLPAEAPIGNYDVDVRVFADGAMSRAAIRRSRSSRSASSSSSRPPRATTACSMASRPR